MVSESEANAAAMSEKGTQGTRVEERDLPPKTDGCLASLPDLEPGDKVRVKTRRSRDRNRTLTVESLGEEQVAKSVSYNGQGEGYTLSGYGTTYSLTRSTSLTGRCARVALVWESKPTGETVENVEVIERAE